MRRFLLFILCITLLTLPVSALSAISSADSETVVESDGTCHVTLTLSLHLDGSSAGLLFPLPENARSITVNGTSAKSSLSGGTRNVPLEDYITAGSGTLTLRYTLEDTITEDKAGNLTLTVPLLSGFSLPVEALAFSITLPDTPDEKPQFTSTYFQENTDLVLNCQISGKTITGSVKERLQDKETLTMTLKTSKEMFPNALARRWSLDTVDLVMLSLAVLALIYWLAAMRCRPVKRIRTAAIPSGMNAGEIGCRLTGQGLDLTLTVLSWAQMGYILIQMNDHGRVLLHKRMEMGNERTETEIRLFRSLFKKRTVVDATGYNYAHLCRKAMRYNPARTHTFLRTSGNPLVFRVLAALIGSVSGVSLAIAYAQDSAWRVVLGILFSILGFAGAWMLQSGAKSLHHRNKLPLLIAIGCGFLFLLASIPAGEMNVAIFVILGEILAGLAAFFGGMRTESGQQTASELLGLRRYLRTATKEELTRSVDLNPNYFYDLAPYALALDVDRAFARQMGNLRLPECTYLTTGMDGHMTAREFDQLLRDTVSAMDILQKRLPIDRLLGK